MNGRVGSIEQSEQNVLVTMGLAPGIVCRIGGVIPKGRAAPSGTVSSAWLVISECSGEDIAEE